MDVDNDNTLDQNLLMQFNCMGTTDKDDLITQLVKLTSGNVSQNTASFFLEMNNWNLQAAICSYYDCEASPNTRLPSMCIDKDELSLEEMSWPPNYRFTKIWNLRNNGAENWPSGCALKFTGGDKLSDIEWLEMNSVPAGSSCQCAVEFVTPSLPSTYKCSWRLVTPFGAYFGDVLWVIVNVTEDEESRELADQLAQSMRVLDAPAPDSAQLSNPFQFTPSSDCSGGGLNTEEDDEDMTS